MRLSPTPPQVWSSSSQSCSWCSRHGRFALFVGVNGRTAPDSRWGRPRKGDGHGRNKTSYLELYCRNCQEETDQLVGPVAGQVTCLRCSSANAVRSEDDRVRALLQRV